jgi:hypothetical protein
LTKTTIIAVNIKTMAKIKEIKATDFVFLFAIVAPLCAKN